MNRNVILIGVVAIVLILALILLARRPPQPVPPAPSNPSSSQAVLNEVVFLPADGQSPFVELKIVGDGASAEGLSLSNERKERYRLPSVGPLERGAHVLVLFDGGNRVDGRTIHADGREFVNRAAGFVELFDGSGKRLDRVAWGPGQPFAVNPNRGGSPADLVAGTSIGRYPLSVARNRFLDWLPFAPEEVTPGRPNPNPRVEVLLPVDGAYFPEPSIELSWYPVAGAAAYRVQVSAGPDFTRILADQQVSSPEFQTPTLDPGDYVWRVQARFADQSTADCSPAGLFTIGTTELPVVPEPASTSFIPNAFAAEPVEPLLVGVLSVPLIYQHKDTAMLLLESKQPDGAHAWDRDHGTLDRTDPADNMNCALASIAMVNHLDESGE